MSAEQLRAFLEKVKGNTSLQEKLKSAADSDSVLAIAKEAGFSVSADDLINAQSKIQGAGLEAAFGGAGTQGCYNSHHLVEYELLELMRDNLPMPFSQ